MNVKKSGNAWTRLIVSIIGLQMGLIFAYTAEWISTRKRESKFQLRDMEDHLV